MASGGCCASARPALASLATCLLLRLDNTRCVGAVMRTSYRFRPHRGLGRNATPRA